MPPGLLNTHFRAWKWNGWMEHIWPISAWTSKVSIWASPVTSTASHAIWTNERTGEEERIPRILRARLQKSGRVSFFPVCCLTYVNSFIRETVKIMSVVKNGGDESEEQHVIYSVGFLLQEEERKLRVGLHTRLRLNLLVSSHTHSHISSYFSLSLLTPDSSLSKVASVDVVVAWTILMCRIITEMIKMQMKTDSFIL